MGTDKGGINTIQFRKLLQMFCTFVVSIWFRDMGCDGDDLGIFGADA